MEYTVHINVAGMWLKGADGECFSIQAVIKNIIAKKKLHVPTIANKVGVNVDTIYRVVNQRQQTSYQTMFKILDAVGVKITMAVCL